MKNFISTLLTTASVALLSGALHASDISVVALRDAAASFPESALRREASGSVTVEFSLADDGRATALDVVASSGSSNFDQAALRAVKRSQFVAVGEGAEQVRIQRTYNFAFAGEVMVDQLAIAAN